MWARWDSLSDTERRAYHCDELRQLEALERERYERKHSAQRLRHLGAETKVRQDAEISRYLTSAPR